MQPCSVRWKYCVAKRSSSREVKYSMRKESLRYSFSDLSFSLKPSYKAEYGCRTGGGTASNQRDGRCSGFDIMFRSEGCGGRSRGILRSLGEAADWFWQDARSANSF